MLGPIISISGIRGRYPAGLSCEWAFKVARAYCKVFHTKRVIIGRDTRRSSLPLSRALASSLRRKGCEILDLGITTTPCLFWSVRSLKGDGGMMVTASHNPVEWNGFKLLAREGRGLYEEELRRMKEELDAEAAPEGSYEFDYYYDYDYGTLRCLRGGDGYLEALRELFGEGCCRGIKLAVDVNGGSASLLAPRLLSELGASVMALGAAPGLFYRAMDPIADDLAQLRRWVVREGCHLGLAFDCDGDRLVVVGPQGEKLPPDHTLLLSLWELRRLAGGTKVAVSIDTTMALEEMAREVGLGEVIRVPVGETNVVRAMLERGIKMGGEGSSGGVIYAQLALCRDGLLAAGLVARMAARGELKDRLDSLPKTHTRRKAIPMERRVATRVVERLAHQEGGEVVDGALIRPDEGSWVLLRCSRTEEALRLSVESRDEARAEELLRLYERKVKELL